MKRLLILGFTTLLTMGTWALDTIHIQDPATWSTAELRPYVGQTVVFDCPMVVSNNRGSLIIGPRRIFAATNQAIPRTIEYNQTVSLNSTAQIYLSGVSDYHRLGEKIYHLKATVNAPTDLSWISGEWRDNTREDVIRQAEERFPELGDYRLLICTANLEYYLTVPNPDYQSTMGPHSYEEHRDQRAKVSQGLGIIGADVYGLVEIESGDSALAEIARDLSRITGRHYSYLHDGTGINGTYTKAGFVYCTETIEPIGKIQRNGGVTNSRSYMQCFEEKATGERFLLSENHFKAKSGGSSADNDPIQGGFNKKRVDEANAVVSQYNRFKGLIKEKDILIMGDLNAYAKEDPIRVFTDAGFTDLHRAFHADSSYSYVYSGQAGYLDHAIANPTMLPQVTGMVGYHVNSDENDYYTYDGRWNDGSMFRYSDHDPVVIGLALKSNPYGEADELISVDEVRMYDQYGNPVSIEDTQIPGMLYIIVEYGTNANNQKIYKVRKTLSL